MCLPACRRTNLAHLMLTLCGMHAKIVVGATLVQLKHSHTGSKVCTNQG